MSSESGITVTQATKLLELGKQHGKVPVVRLFSKNASQHAHRALLLGISGNTAIVKPYGHRRTEEVDLSVLRFWKAGNDFDISEAEGCVAPLETEAAVADIAKQRYVVYNSGLRGYWYGENQRWRTSPMNALEYADGAEGPILSALIARFGPFLRLVPIEEARLDWVNDQKKRYHTNVSDERMLLEKQRSALLHDYNLIRNQLLDIDQRIKELGGKQVVLTTPIPTPTQVFRSTRPKASKTWIRQDVLSILRRYPQSSLETIHQQLILVKPNCTMGKVKTCLINMRSVQMAVCENDKWSLAM